MPAANDQQELAQLGHRLKVIESLEEHRDGTHYDLAAPDSDLAHDDASLGYLKASQLVGHCLSVALDALRTTRLILVDPSVPTRIRLPMIGQYPALRTALESSAVAIWLQRPEVSKDRVIRSLSARWEDIIRDNQLALLMTESEPGDEKAQVSRLQRARRTNAKAVGAKKKYLRELAAAASIPEDAFKDGMPGFGPIVADASQDLPIRASFTRATWHAISGLTHPSMSRSMALSLVEYLEGQGPSGDRALVTANPATVNLALNAALSMYLSALTITGRRGNNPLVTWQPGRSVPLPPGYEMRDNVVVRAQEPPSAK